MITICIFVPFAFPGDYPLSIDATRPLGAIAQGGEARMGVQVSPEYAECTGCYTYFWIKGPLPDGGSFGDLELQYIGSTPYIPGKADRWIDHALDTTELEPGTYLYQASVYRYEGWVRMSNSKVRSFEIRTPEALKDYGIEDMYRLGYVVPGESVKLGVQISPTEGAECDGCKISFWIKGPREEGGSWDDLAYTYLGSTPFYDIEETEWFEYSWQVPENAASGDYRYLSKIYEKAFDKEMKRSPRWTSLFTVSPCPQILQIENPGFMYQQETVRMSVLLDRPDTTLPPDCSISFYLQRRSDDETIEELLETVPYDLDDPDHRFEYHWSIPEDAIPGSYGYKAIVHPTGSHPEESEFQESVEFEIRERTPDIWFKVSDMFNPGVRKQGENTALIAKIDPIEGGKCDSPLKETDIEECSSARIFFRLSGPRIETQEGYDWPDYEALFDMPYDPEDADHWFYHEWQIPKDMEPGRYKYYATVYSRNKDTNERMLISEGRVIKDFMIIRSESGVSAPLDPYSEEAVTLTIKEIKNGRYSCAQEPHPVSWKVKRLGEDTFEDYSSNCEETNYAIEELGLGVGESRYDLSCTYEDLPSFYSGPHRAMVNWCEYTYEFDYGYPMEFDWSHKILPNAAPADPEGYASTEGSRADWMSPVKQSQGKCGCCWAYATLAVMEAKTNILANDPDLDTDLSEEYLISCSTLCGDCCGSFSVDLFKQLQIFGIPGENAMPYQSENCWCDRETDTCCDECDQPTSCSATLCRNIDKDRIWQIRDSGRVSGRKIIKEKLITEGPLMASMDFRAWDTKTLSCDHESGLRHRVVIMGYSDTERYWIVRNSYGPTWGPSSNGYFKVKYGECQIEDNVDYVTEVYLES